MFAAPESLEQLLACRGHLYILRHATEEKFRILGSSSFLTPKQREKAFEGTDWTGSQALLLNDDMVRTQMGNLFRQLSNPYLAPNHLSGGIRWYTGEGVRALGTLLVEQGHEAWQVPLATLYPASSTERHALSEARTAFEERRAHAQRQATAEESARRAEAAAQNALRGQERLLAHLRQCGTFIDSRQPGEAWQAALTHPLAELNKLSGGHCEFNASKGQLKVWTLRTHWTLAQELVSALHGWFTGPHDPKYLPEPGQLSCVNVFGPVQRESFSSTPHTHCFSLTLSDLPTPVHQALLELKPGIRGWDLALDAKVLGFDPARSKRFAKKLPPAPAPRWAQLWDQAYALENGDELPPDWVARLGEKAWFPPGVRLATADVTGSGVNELLVLLRDEHGATCGVQRIRTDDWSRQLLHADGPLTDAHARLFLPKAEVAVATTLEDAFALREALRIPVWFVPTPQALRALPLLPGMQRCYVCLLSETTAAPEAWQDAVRTLTARAGTSTVVQAVQPCGTRAAHETPYAERLRRAQELAAGQFEVLS